MIDVRCAVERSGRTGRGRIREIRRSPGVPLKRAPSQGVQIAVGEGSVGAWFWGAGSGSCGRVRRAQRRPLRRNWGGAVPLDAHRRPESEGNRGDGGIAEIGMDDDIEQAVVGAQGGFGRTCRRHDGFRVQAPESGMDGFREGAYGAGVAAEGEQVMVVAPAGGKAQRDERNRGRQSGHANSSVGGLCIADG